MSKQHRNNPSAKQETQLKNRNKGIVAGVLLLSFAIIGTLTFEDTFSENNPESPSSRLTNTYTETQTPTQATESLDEQVSIEETESEQDEIVGESDVLDEDVSRIEEPISATDFSEERKEEVVSPAREAIKPVPATRKAAPKTTQSITSSVQWAGMNASIEGGDAMIRWTTLDEKYTDYFEIERSIDEEVFESLGRVKGKDLTSFNERNYVFADSSLKFVGMPRIYYKINQIGLDGKTHSSEIYEYDLGLNLDLYLRVEEIKDGMLTVSYAADKEGKASVGVLTPSGEVLYEEEVEVGFIPKRRKVNASVWGEGVYLLVLFDENTRVTEMLEIGD